MAKKTLPNFYFFMFFPSTLCNIMLLNDAEDVDVCKYNPLLVGWLVGCPYKVVMEEFDY
jgi:hypothetical protein